MPPHPKSEWLGFLKSDTFTGWICKKCEWRYPRPKTDVDPKELIKVVVREFAKHDCKDYQSARSA